MGAMGAMGATGASSWVRMGATFTFADLLEKLDGTPANWKSDFRKATLLRVRKSLAHHKAVAKKRSTLNVETQTTSRWVNRMSGPAGVSSDSCHLP